MSRMKKGVLAEDGHDEPPNLHGGTGGPLSGGGLKRSSIGFIERRIHSNRLLNRKKSERRR